MELNLNGLLQFTSSSLQSYFQLMNRRDKNSNTMLNSVDLMAGTIAAQTQRKYNSNYDYDTMGYYQQYGSFLPRGIQANNGHLTDEYKKWNHPTQAVESKLYLGGYKAVNWNKEPYAFLAKNSIL